MAGLLAGEGYHEHMDGGAPGQIHIERYWLASPNVSHRDQTATLGLSAGPGKPAVSGNAKEHMDVARAKQEGA